MPPSVPLPAPVSDVRPAQRLYVWTAETDARLVRLRADGLGTRTIARFMGISRNRVINRALWLGAPANPVRSTIPQAGDSGDPNRAALPPGHAITWFAITSGTCLEGNDYTPPRQPRHRIPA